MTMSNLPTSPTRARSAYLCCPAYPLVDAAHHQRAVAMASRFAVRAGLTLVTSPLLARHPGAGAWLDRAERCADLEAALAHDVLIAARGGYGCLDLLDVLPAGRPPGDATVIGYSDLTVLHAAWRARGWGETVYGFMPGVPGGDRALESAAAALAGDGLVLDPASDPAVEAVGPGNAAGWLFGACLRVLAGLVGTPAMPSLSGCILALEDVDERPYRVDRDLQQLWRAGLLSGVTGLVGGVFPAGLPDGYRGPGVADVLRAWSGRLGIPAIVGLPFGHHADPVALPCGRNARLECAAGGTWRLAIAGR
jgi:muramoyltetrapeptide carboxypeptidase